jgi:hypothetical protein
MQTPQGLDATHGDELFPLFEFLEEMEDRPRRAGEQIELKLYSAVLCGGAEPTNFGAPLTMRVRL